MRFTRIEVESFKQFEHIAVDFPPGLTVIEGPNEAGKSTLQEALVAALFLDPTAPTIDVQHYIPWGHTQKPRLVLHFDVDGATHVLRKDFEAGTIFLVSPGNDPGTATETRDAARIQQRITEYLGIGSLTVYVATACMRSEDVSRLPATAGTISKRLQTYVTGTASVDATEVLTGIDAELLAMGPASAPRGLGSLLYTSRERVAMLRRNRDSAAQHLKTRVETTQRLTQARVELARLETAASNLKQRLERAAAAQAIATDLAFLQEHLQHLVQLEQTHRSAGMDQSRASDLNGEAMTRALEAGQELDQKLLTLKLEEADLNHKLAIQALKRLDTRSPWRFILFAAGSVIACAGIALVLALHKLIYLPVLVAGALVAVVTLLWRNAEGANAPDAIALQAVTQQLEEVRGQIETLLAPFKLHTVAELAAQVRAMRATDEYQKLPHAQIERLLGRPRPASLTEERALVERAIAARSAMLAQETSDPLPAEEAGHGTGALEDLERQRKATQQEMYRLEAEARASDVTSESVAQLEEELADEQVRLARMERRRTGLELARSGIREAINRTLAQASDVFRSEVSRHIEPITGGRYSRVEGIIDETGLHLMVETADHGALVPADSLSQGTQDQIYLAARLALLQVIAGGKQPPILLDDPFVAYDDTRLRATIQLLKRLHQQAQIVLFTCSGRYDTFADAIVHLSAPVGVQASINAAGISSRP